LPRTPTAIKDVPVTLIAPPRLVCQCCRFIISVWFFAFFLGDVQF
jgi:hypothetical protein